MLLELNSKLIPFILFFSISYIFYIFFKSGKFDRFEDNLSFEFDIFLSKFNYKFRRVLISLFKYLFIYRFFIFFFSLPIFIYYLFNVFSNFDNTPQSNFDLVNIPSNGENTILNNPKNDFISKSFFLHSVKREGGDDDNSIFIFDERSELNIELYKAAFQHELLTTENCFDFLKDNTHRLARSGFIYPLDEKWNKVYLHPDLQHFSFDTYNIKIPGRLFYINDHRDIDTIISFCTDKSVDEIFNKASNDVLYKFREELIKEGIMVKSNKDGKEVFNFISVNDFNDYYKRLRIFSKFAYDYESLVKARFDKYVRFYTSQAIGRNWQYSDYPLIKKKPHFESWVGKNYIDKNENAFFFQKSSFKAWSAHSKYFSDKDFDEYSSEYLWSKFKVEKNFYSAKPLKRINSAYSFNPEKAKSNLETWPEYNYYYRPRVKYNSWVKENILDKSEAYKNNDNEALLAEVKEYNKNVYNSLVEKEKSVDEFFMNCENYGYGFIWFNDGVELFGREYWLKMESFTWSY